MRKTIQLLTFFGVLLPLILRAQHAPLTHAELMPYFPGCHEYADGSAEKRQCSNERLVKYIAEHITYPDSAKKAGIEGTVLIQFIVDEKGQITDASVLRDIGGGCGEAALAVLTDMPSWEPARDKGQYVRVKLNLPVQFFFKGSEEAESDLYTINWGNLNSATVSQEELEEHMYKNIMVRDPFGNAHPITELIFTYERKKKYKEEKSRGKMTKDMRKFIKKVKKNGQFSIIAVVQHEGSFVYVRKSFTVTD